MASSQLPEKQCMMPRGSVPDAWRRRISSMASPCASRMCKLHRHIQFQCQIQLPLNTSRCASRGERVVVVVQPDLAQHRALGKRQQPAQRLFPLV